MMTDMDIIFVVFILLTLLSVPIMKKLDDMSKDNDPRKVRQANIYYLVLFAAISTIVWFAEPSIEHKPIDFTSKRWVEINIFDRKVYFQTP